MTEIPEPEILMAERAFAEAQALLEGERLTTAVQGQETLPVGWYDTDFYPRLGSFALASLERADLVGEILRVTRGSRSCFVYCVARRDVDPFALVLSRRAYWAIANLAVEQAECLVEIVG